MKDEINEAEILNSITDDKDLERPPLQVIYDGLASKRPLCLRFDCGTSTYNDAAIS